MSLLSRLSAYAAVAALGVAAALPLPAARADEPKAVPPAPASRPVDLVLCLDVSGSMNGLIDSAKMKLWDIVNELARMKPTPDLRVALYSYGHDTYPAANGWVRKDMDLTTDLDDVYKALNGLRTNGGTELVARVTQTALTEQKWSADPTALKLIFVCGNEPVDQDKQVTLDSVAAQAKGKGVIVNTIYCSWNHPEEVAGWQKFAELCGGRHVTIDQNKGAKPVAIKTEYDAEILKFNDALNGTYVAYGKEGKDRFANQKKQDDNAAAAAPAAAIGRAESKAGGLYRNGHWDLVDKMKEKDFDLAKIKDEDLPDELKKLKPEERLEFLKKKAAEREELQKKIAELTAKRQKVIDAELAKQPKTDAEKALDEAVKGVVRDLAKAKGFEPAGGK